MEYLNHHTYLVLALMSCGIIMTRLGGFWLAGHIKLNKCVQDWFECLPDCILMAIVAPMMRNADWVEWVAAIVVVLVMLKTDKILYAMLAGIILTALGHAIFSGVESSLSL